MNAEEFAIKHAGRNCEYINQGIKGIIFGYSHTNDIEYVWMNIINGGDDNYSLEKMRQHYEIVCLMPVNDSTEVIGVPYEEIYLLEGGMALDKEIIQELIKKLEL